MGLRPTLDQKKSDPKLFFYNDHELYLMGQKNTFSDYSFSEERLSEEQLIRKSGKNKNEEVIRKKVTRIIVGSDTKASPRRMDAKVRVYAFKHRPRVGWRQTWMTVLRRWRPRWQNVDTAS